MRISAQTRIQLWFFSLLLTDFWLVTGAIWAQEHLQEYSRCKIRVLQKASLDGVSEEEFLCMETLLSTRFQLDNLWWLLATVFLHLKLWLCR